MNLPNKFISVPQSVIGNMLLLMGQIKGGEIPLDILQNKLKHKMELVDMIEALTCLYAIGRVEIKNHIIIGI
mgnify:FL=1